MLLTEEQQQLIEQVEQLDKELADKLYIQFVHLHRKVNTYHDYLKYKLGIEFNATRG